MNKKFALLIFFLAWTFCINAQEAEKTDSVRVLDPIIIKASIERTYLPETSNVNVFAGKKSDVITLHDGEANLSQNNGRTIFSKIPGLNLWDMDGAGTQMNLGTRGTDAHRSIEMNMRQNGYNTNSDMFGYPENHYTVAMQAVRQVQLVRGSAALQFGSQFGGMMNYIMKEGDANKVFSLESEQTVGSYNMFNSFNAIGGTVGKINYYAYYNNRHGDGWRPNAAFNYQSMYGSVKYSYSERGSVTFQFSRMDYSQQIAGGLTDAQFNANPQQSNRARNWFSPKINVPAAIFNHDVSSRTKIQIIANGIWGERSSVQFINTANVNDTINTSIGSYNPRQVDRDYYSGFAAEARLLHRYEINRLKATLAGGIRYSSNATHRQQKGTGTVGSDLDFSLVAPYQIDLNFQTVNYAGFVENIFQLGERFSVTPGIRYEVINSDLTGVISNAGFPISYKGNRSFPLFGVGLQHQLKTTQFYANVSQAYRPYLYANITPADQVGVIDPNLRDSHGYNIDFGYRGHLRDVLRFDVNYFYLFYADKIGKLTTTPASGTPYQLTTNIGNSVAQGFELYANFSLLRLLAGSFRNTDLRLFSSIAYTRARFTKGELSNGVENVSLVGNHVEGVPDWINRSGLEFRFKAVTSTLQASYVSEQFNDANNTVVSSTGVVGLVPAYAVFDFAFDFRFLEFYHVSAGINNIADSKYFSRRISMYPGPGILPADGRTAYFSLGFKI